MAKGMAMRDVLSRKLRPLVSGTALLLATAGTVAAQGACGLCQQEIVTTPDLAECFLQRYDRLAGSNGSERVIVDLTDCERSRSIVDALPTVDTMVEEPDLRFMVVRSQLDCLKARLEDPEVDLDPSARIRLDSCG